ncbi:unnamed protein product [Schistocephalus solidus]|uniref:Proteasome activator complex subunit 3 n=1 Tax=Schistocephalus solidus TaxID=70667 RepID=A0A183SEB3_SCHSO|nr:unnamed protein product [Schistocephalus solidus]
MLFFCRQTDEVSSKLQQYKEKTKIDGENLVRTVFPKRVFEMEQLLSSKLYSMSPSSVFQKINLPLPNQVTGDSQAQGDVAASVNGPVHGSPVYTFAGGNVPFNAHIREMIEQAKPYLTQLMVEAQLVRLWVQFNVPRIEDGNNFGVSIQEEVLSEASGIERDALTFLDQFTRYYASRGKLVGKVAKFPHIEDYRECIRDMDEKQAISVRYVIMEIRNHYAVLHDLIVKNIDRIKVPRSNNTISMY